MKVYSYCILICLIIFNIVNAQTPILDQSTVVLPKAKTLNKCIGEDQVVTYTQFECDQNATKVIDNWRDESNLTFSSPLEDIKKSKEASVYSKDQKIKSGNATGIELLKDKMKDKSLMELFDQGIKAMIMQKDTLDSL